MQDWLTLALVVLSGGILISILIIIFHNSCRPGVGQQPHHVVTLHAANKTDHFLFRRLPPANPLFTWSDHPSLAAAAVENGWSDFGFAAYSPPRKNFRAITSLFGGDQGRSRMTVDIRWEVFEGSPEVMQKIQFRQDSGTLKKNKSSALAMAKTSLPLPGPALGNVCFPQEAYFEITILGVEKDNHKPEGEKIKLIGSDQFQAKASKSQPLVQELGGDGKGIKKRRDLVALSVGLTGSCAPPLKFPGTYPASVGFNSNASVYLQGTELVEECDGGEGWESAVEKVIGCGYNPSQHKVIFTVDSQLLCEIHYNSDEFGSPLYPTIVSTVEIAVVVNFGQTPFKYAPANLQRTPNPCFFPHLPPSTIRCSYEDSKELFSMGRINSGWLMIDNESDVAATNNIKHDEFDLESEGDLFEIILDGSGKQGISKHK